MREARHMRLLAEALDRVSPANNVIHKMYGIYKGSVHLMTNRIYWNLHIIIQFLRLGLRFSTKRKIRFIQLPRDETELLYLNPNKIKYALVGCDTEAKKYLPIEDGTWDLRTEEFANTDIFTSLKEHFLSGIPLEDTKYYAKALNRKNRGISTWDCKPADEFAGKSRVIEGLFSKIKAVGKMTQNDLENGDLSNEIEVAVGRNGNFLLENGSHLLSLAKISGIDTIPVKVTRRHYRWAKFRKEVFVFSQEAIKGTYQPLIHPDLQRIRCHRKEDRWELMANNLPNRHGTVLDIGANLGYFCHKFEELGFDCYAVERNYKYLYFLKKLRVIEHRKFKTLPQSVFDIKTKKYDIVLAFSIFHHFLRTKDLYHKMTKFLGELDMKIMFFEPHETGHGFENAYIDYSEIEFVNYVLENSCLNKYKFLGRGERGRSLYLLS